MQRRLPKSAIVFLAGLGVVPALVMALYGHTMVMPPLWVHFYGVGVSALVAAAAAATLVTIGARRRDARTVVVAGGFTIMATLLAVHGLVTPGCARRQQRRDCPDRRRHTAGRRCGARSVELAPAELAALDSLRDRPAGRDLRRDRRRQPGRRARAAPRAERAGSALDGGLGAAGRRPRPLRRARRPRREHLPAHPPRRRPRRRRRASCSSRPRSTAHSRSPSWISAGGSATSFELVGITLVGASVAYDLRRGSQSRPLVGDLRAAEIVAAEEAFLGARVRALMVRLAAKDTSTEEHTRRVAALAVEIGEQLGLSPTRLRSLAIGGLLHDIGKLSVPESILQKPDSLDDDEYAVIKLHPERGRELLNELGGFDETVGRLVLDHHERLDGTGYPRGLGRRPRPRDPHPQRLRRLRRARLAARLPRRLVTRARRRAAARGGVDRVRPALRPGASARRGRAPFARPVQPS